MKKKNNIRIILITNIFLSIITFILFLFGIFPSRIHILKEKLIPSSPNNLKLTFTKCESSKDCGGHFDPVINETKWLNENTFCASITIPGNLGDIYWIGDYDIKDNALILKYKTINETFMSCGYCPVKLEYKINNIAKKDYQISIEKK